jgi:hypothetical protein
MRSRRPTKDRPKAVSREGITPCLDRINSFSSSRAASGPTLTILVVESGDLVSGGKTFPKAGKLFPRQRSRGVIVPLQLSPPPMFFSRGWLSTCYVPHQPVTFKMGIATQCVKTASEINENRTVATAARKIQNINLMPGPSGYGVPWFVDASVLIWTAPTAARKPPVRAW